MELSTQSANHPERNTTIETDHSYLDSVPLPFASVAFSDTYHAAMLRNLSVDGGMVVFSQSHESYYVSSTVGLPNVSQLVEREVSSLCRMISTGVFITNDRVLRLTEILNHLPQLRTLVRESGFKYLRVYRINDFLAARGYWLMYFSSLTRALDAGNEIQRSLSSPQFGETFSDFVANGRREKALDEIIASWVTLLDKRDKETETHTKRVAQLTERFARRLEINGESMKDLRRGALLHDIGKIVIPDEILFKPGPLSDSEWRIMQMHPKIVKDLLSHFNVPEKILEIPYHHHEQWDGSGYPDGLSGEQIPLSARIFTLVDVYDAMRVDRPYRKFFPRDEVLAYIESQSGIHFDPEITPVFLELVRTDN